VAGVEGTLVEHLKGTPADGRLRAKTGSLTGVRTLTGLFPSTDGTETVHFAFMLQRAGIYPPENAVDPYWAKLVDALATFPARPDLTPFLPRPALG
jgi:D-alanyl-D-alanine carboxypeptidase/D-alanyl-D-alanine-endopeptidase (penicillin-binding protein 4)